MKHLNLRNTLGVAVLIGGAIVGASALADPQQGTCGPGYGMGPGMMGGQGYDPGMMGGPGCGSAVGPGMTGGPGYGHRMGPGMMDEQGFGMRRGMMAGYGPGADLNLTAEQGGKIAKIQNDVRRKHWELMGKLRDEQSQMNELYYSDELDDAELSKSYRNMWELRQQMFDLSLSARRQIDAVLTTEQRAKVRHG